MAHEQQRYEKGAVVSTDSSSLLALASELAKHDERFQRAKGGIKAPRAVKKPTIWQRQNPGLAKRSRMNDVSLKSGEPEGEAARSKAMERKAKMYERLKRGEQVPDRIREELLVEFEYGHRGRSSRSRGRREGRDRSAEESDSYSDSDYSRSRSRSRSKDSRDWGPDESRALARDPRDFKDYKDDPWVEHVDEFGRSRLVRKSEIPRPVTPPPAPAPPPGIHHPSNPFPVFRNPDAMEKEEWIRDATGDMKNSGTFGSKVNSSGERHYDNTTERRARGVGFYAFSQNEEERQKQMRELLELRSQTESKIAQHKSLKDKRREEIEARKRLIAQKRLKSLASTVSAS